MLVSDATMGLANPSLFLQETTNFMLTQIAANMFDRGWLETGYYHYGSDFRSGGSDNFCLSYMTCRWAGGGCWITPLNYAGNEFPGLPAPGLRFIYGRMETL